MFLRGVVIGSKNSACRPFKGSRFGAKCASGKSGPILNRHVFRNDRAIDEAALTPKRARHHTGPPIRGRHLRECLLIELPVRWFPEFHHPIGFDLAQGLDGSSHASSDDCERHAICCRSGATCRPDRVASDYLEAPDLGLSGMFAESLRQNSS